MFLLVYIKTPVRDYFFHFILFHFIKTMQVPQLASNTTKPPGTPAKPEEAKNVRLFQPFTQKSVTIHNRIGVSIRDKNKNKN